MLAACQENKISLLLKKENEKQPAICIVITQE